jgi:hypothetical protein
MPPPTDDTPLAREVELGRLEMESNWQLRQENVLPLETAWNEGRFYGLVLKGRQRFTGFQRAGIFVMGLQAIGVASSMLLLDWPIPQVGPSLKSVYHRFPNADLYRMPVLLLVVVLGMRFCWVAVRGASTDSTQTPSKPEDKLASS